MNNLYRGLAPITEEAWGEIELEAIRTFKRHIAGRLVVDVSEPGGPVTAAISTGHLVDVTSPGDGVVAHLRGSKPLVRLRVPFTISRTDVDDVERGSQDSDWDPVKRPRSSWRSRRTVRSSRAMRPRRSTASASAAPTPPWRCRRIRARSPTSSARR